MRKQLVIKCLKAGFVGLILLLLYAICYFARQMIESRRMGNHMGAHPLFILIAIYAGWKLFGATGVLLGPASLVIFQELYTENKKG